MDIGVDKNLRRLGVGTAIVKRLLGRAFWGLKMGRPRLIIRLPEDCMGSLLFFKEMGFIGHLIKTDAEEEYDTVQMEHANKGGK